MTKKKKSSWKGWMVYWRGNLENVFYFFKQDAILYVAREVRIGNKRENFSIRKVLIKEV